MPESVVGSLFNKTLSPVCITRLLIACLFVCVVVVVFSALFYIISLALLIKLQRLRSAINLNLIFMLSYLLLFQSY